MTARPSMLLLTACRDLRQQCRSHPMRAGSAAVRIRLKGVKTVRRYRKDGTCAIYYCHRASGRALKGQPGTEEFLESLAAAQRSVRERAKGTIADLIQRFAGALSPKLETVQLDPSPEFAAMEEHESGVPA